MALKFKTRFWQVFAAVMLTLFIGWSIVASSVLRECYRPSNGVAKVDKSEVAIHELPAADQTRKKNSSNSTSDMESARKEIRKSTQKRSNNKEDKSEGLWNSWTKRLSGDRSGASAVCIAILLLALARYGYLRWRLTLQRSMFEKQGSERQLKAMLGPKDPVVLFLSTRRTESDVELLERRIASSYDLHDFISPCITLGLFGTLVGLWIGFTQTLGPTASLAAGSLNLQTALTSSVVVVATAALSSITGIGLGQLVIAPLADRVDRDVDALIISILDKS